jgi:hypothetical protein
MTVKDGFNLEPYHVAGTHTQLLAYGDYYALSRQYGLRSVSSYDTRDSKFQMALPRPHVRRDAGKLPIAVLQQRQHAAHPGW